MKKAIIIGASSGIGRELAKVLGNNRYSVALVGRREELLLSLKEEMDTETLIQPIDISQGEVAIRELHLLMEEMGVVDLVIVAAGCGFENPHLSYEKEERTVQVNVLGFMAMANTAYQFFLRQGYGQLVGLSSIAALRGGDDAPAYYASKAYISNYMEGLRKKAFKQSLPILITDIKPGFVDTAMARGEGLFWVAKPERAALQIYRVISKKKSHGYITRRWRLIAWLLKVLPAKLYYRF